MTTIVSIDNGDPDISMSTTAFVKMIFDENVVGHRQVMTYTGSFKHQEERINEFVKDADYIVIEKIDSTNKFISRSVIAEQISLRNFLLKTGPVHELIRSGRKEIITDDLLKQVNLYIDNFGTHHNDVREATRNLLYFMAKDKRLNLILSDYVQHFFK